MPVTSSNLKKGITIKVQGKLYLVIDVDFMKQGRGGGNYRTKLRDIAKGTNVKITFKTGETIDIIDTEKKNVTFLYKNGEESGEEFFFMDDESFEQFSFDLNFVTEKVAKFLKEEQKMILFYAEGEPVNVTFPNQKISFKIITADPGVKGDTANNPQKPVTIETGAEIYVPLFIKEGDTVIVNIETEEYSGKS